jgi:hypothetical protein
VELQLNLPEITEIEQNIKPTIQPINLCGRQCLSPTGHIDCGPLSVLK